MAALTWQNINAPDLRGVQAGYTTANDMFNGSIDSLGKILKGQESVIKDQWGAMKDVNTQAFMDRLAAVKTPEELQALEASGALAQMREGFGGQVDRTATRNAQEARLGLLRDAQNKQFTYETTMRKRNEEPVLLEANRLAALNDFDGARKLIESSNLYDKGAALQSVQTSETAKKQATAADIALQIAQQQNIDKAGEVAATNYFSNALQSHLNNVNQLELDQGAVARSLNLPVTQDGRPDYDQIAANPALQAAFDQGINEHSTEDGRSLQIPTDTEAFKNVFKNLPADISPAVAQKVGQGFNFSSNPVDQLKGGDKANYEAAIASMRDRKAKAEASNSLFVSSKNSVDRLPDLRAQLIANGVDKEGARIALEEVTKQLQDNPDTPLHIPAIINAASKYEGFSLSGILSNDWATFRGRFKTNMANIQKTDAYKKQLQEHLSYNDDNARVAERAAITKLLSKARSPQQRN